MIPWSIVLISLRMSSSSSASQFAILSSPSLTSRSRRFFPSVLQLHPKTAEDVHDLSPPSLGAPCWLHGPEYSA